MESNFCCLRAAKNSIFSGAILTIAFATAVRAADPAPTFFRGLNLNGPPVMIDGHAWEGRDSKQYACSDSAFDSQNVTLVPATDSERAKMIRSSRWGGNRIDLTEIPTGTYSLFLYVWEDNNPETYSIAVNGRQVEARYNSGPGGHWEKLGPWYTSPQDGKIVLTSRGGAANFSGIELWRGKFDGQFAHQRRSTGVFRETHSTAAGGEVLRMP